MFYYSKKKYIEFLALIVSASVFSCNEENAQNSETKDLTAGKVFTSSQSETTQEVIIWYASENLTPVDPQKASTPYQKNWHKMMAAFQAEAAAKDPKTEKAAAMYLKAMQDDIKNSVVARRGNEQQLISLLCDNPANEKSGLILFTNLAMTTKKITYCEPGKAAQTVALSEGQFAAFQQRLGNRKEDVILADNPLAHPAALDWALNFTKTLKGNNGAAVFPSSIFSYSLLATAHGGQDWALVSKPIPQYDLIMKNNNSSSDPMKKFMVDFAQDVSVRPTGLYSLISSYTSSVYNYAMESLFSSQDEGLKSKNDGGKSKNDGGKSKNDGGKSKNDGGKSKNDGGKSKNDGGKAADDELGIAGSNYAFQIRGIQKAQFAQTLLKHSDMRFSLVFIDSCGSFLDQRLETLIQNKNIALLFTSDKDGLPWVVVQNYSDIMNREDLSYVRASVMIRQTLDRIASQND
jgi:hypothetical protein